MWRQSAAACAISEKETPQTHGTAGNASETIVATMCESTNFIRRLAGSYGWLRPLPALRRWR